MTANHQSGPSITYGTPQGSGQSNPHAGPSVSYQGDAFIDVRVPYAPGIDGKSTHVWSHIDTPYLLLVDALPATKGAANISAAANLVALTAVTLAAASTGITVGNSIQSPIWVSSAKNTVTGLLAMDGVYAPLTVGVINQMFDPTKSITRCVSCTGVSGGTGGTALISGYDLYGVPMTQLLTLPLGALVTTTTKAFKYIASIVPQTASLDTTHAYSFGTSDTLGINIRSTKWEYTNFYVAGAFITANTGYTAAVDTAATNLTGDVRGTYVLQTASNGTNRVAMFLSLQLADIVAATVASPVSMYGVTQA